jgi:hypothetical protein
MLSAVDASKSPPSSLMLKLLLSVDLALLSSANPLVEKLD